MQKDEGRTETTDRTADRLPEREQETDGRERLLATAERPRVLLPVVVLRQVLIVGIYLQNDRRQNPLCGSQNPS